MSSFRKILYPFSLVYGLITSIRNYGFDQGILRSRSFDLPLIAVGNLNVGGTGKSPMIEYLIRLLNDRNHVAVLSRGYGRKTKGFRLASDKSSAREIGDEPFQFYRKFKNLDVAVDEKRVHGIEQLKELRPEVDLILLDDAFQHRQVSAGFYIVLTAYDKLYVNDLLLPAGDLREPRKGADRADIIVVSKSPLDIGEKKRKEIVSKIDPKPNQHVFFSAITYGENVIGRQDNIPLSALNTSKILLVTGIAKTKPLEDFLHSRQIIFEHMKFADHEFIDEQKLEALIAAFDRISNEKKIILTTEKDYVRSFLNVNLPVYYLPIKTEIIEKGEKFNELIQKYVREN